MRAKPFAPLSAGAPRCCRRPSYYSELVAGEGLAICKRIVERHGGTIRAESGPGRGAAFHITLPERQAGGE